MRVTILHRKKWAVDECDVIKEDFVLIVDLQSPRNTWRKGEVIQVFPGSDNVTRVAKIVTSLGEYVRPVHKLINLYSEKVQN